MKKFAKIVLGAVVIASAASLGMATTSGTSAVEKEEVVALLRKSAVEAAKAEAEKTDADGVESNESEERYNNPQTGTSERECYTESFALKTSAYGLNIDPKVLENGGTMGEALISVDWTKMISYCGNMFEGNKETFDKFIQGFKDHYQEICDAMSELAKKIEDWFSQH